MGYRMSSWSIGNEILLLYSRGVSSLAVASPVLADQVADVMVDQVADGNGKRYCLKSTGYIVEKGRRCRPGTSLVNWW